MDVIREARRAYREVGDERAIDALEHALVYGELALEDADAVQMLRVQRERGGGTGSLRSYVKSYQLTPERAARMKDSAIVMHPGPMNRGVEIDPDVADDPERSVIQEQVEMGVAVRMAVMDLLSRNIPNAGADAA